MRVVALISGGKDSCYSMMQCVAAGHQIVALANLQPQDNDELDSFMFQTVGHEGIELYAEAMGLPLYRVNTQGRAFAQELQYSPVEGDEVEDLYRLLRRVRGEAEVEGVACGAVLSDYQRLRVENVCSRLGVVCLAYLWRRDQEELLQEMIEARVKAVIIKVASMGLTPDKHLGKTIAEVYPELCKLHRQYGINVCGEGGEYETFTLDCPLFLREIVVISSEVCIHSDDAFAPVAYLKLKELKLKDKPVEVTATVNTLVPPCSDKVIPGMVPEVVLPTRQEIKCVRRGKWVWLAGDGEAHLDSASEQTEQLLTALGGRLSGVGSCWGDVVLVYLYLAHMTDYAAVNAAYASLFPRKPPARVCIQLSLPEGVLVRMEGVCGERGEGDGRSSMHVQSISHWAPANIGPYSQAYSSSDIVFTAGQIGLHPGGMALAEEVEQPTLSLTHVQRVLGACHAHLGSALCGICYFTTEEAGWTATQTWAESRAGSSACPLAFLRVPALPRGACVEWHFIAVHSSPHTVAYWDKSWVEGDVGVISLQEAWSPVLELGCWTATVAPLPFPVCHLLEAVKAGLQAIATALSQHQLQLRHITFLRICPPKYASGPPLCAEDVSSVLGCTAIAMSLQPTEGFYGPSAPLVLQACQLDPCSETPQ